MDENAEASGVHRVVQIRIFQDDERALSSHFEDTAFAALSALDGDDSSHGRRSRKGNELHARIVEEHAREGGAIAGNNVKNSSRNTGAFENFGELQTNEGSFFRRLQNKSISAGQRKREFFQRKDDGKVEGRNPSDDTERTANGHGDHARHIGRKYIAANASSFAS